MYDIRQFKPTLYTLLIVGISSFALAAQTPGLWLLAMVGIGLNAWLVAVGRFRPLPRTVANVVTLGSMGYVAYDLFNSPLTPVLVLGQFLVFLQLVKLWEQRANRDYAQLLILSLLLVIAAAMSTASMWFGLLLVAYLILSLYCCLLFHLKVETDLARSAMPVPHEKLSPGTLRQDQRHLSRSMRRLTGLVSIVAIGSAAGVFLLFPRGSGGGFLGPLQRAGPPLTGFSPEVKFQDVARITQSHEKVAFVRLWHNDEPVAGTRPLLLRGVTLDHYGQTRMGTWEWTRRFGIIQTVRPDKPLDIATDAKDLWRQEISLWPTRTDVLFALAGPVRLTPQSRSLRYYLADGALETTTPINERINYEVISTDSLGQGVGWSTQALPDLVRLDFPKVYDLAQRSEVSGADASGPLARRRIAMGEEPSPLDQKIASSIEKYLRDHCSYTLDLSDESRLRDRDPLEAFLFDWKKGHCEYFAGAMTLMCQSLGLQARVVVGFKVGPENYNEYAGGYTVYQSDAHAWVEVKTPSGWMSFDPTSTREATARSEGIMSRARWFLEYLELTYANAIIAYDAQNRNSIVASIEGGMTTTASRGSEWLAQFRDFLANSFWNLSTLVLSGVVLAMVGVVAVACAWFLWERWRLRRRAARIGIESLPQAEQLRLARQLGFYDELLRLLDRHRIRRPSHFTPMEFSRSLTFLSAAAYDTIDRLTSLFYRVRYGGREISDAQQQHLHNALTHLGNEIAQAASHHRAI